MKLTTEQMFNAITLGSLSEVILLNRPINIYPGIGGVIDMELEECIKDNFDESLRVYIQSQEYTRLKQQEDRLLSYLQAGLS